MLIRALIVLLIVLNLGAAAWWISRPAAQAPALPEQPAGVARLQLLGESRATAKAAPPASVAMRQCRWRRRCPPRRRPRSCHRRSGAMLQRRALRQRCRGHRRDCPHRAPRPRAFVRAKFLASRPAATTCCCRPCRIARPRRRWRSASARPVSTIIWWSVEASRPTASPWVATAAAKGPNAASPRSRPPVSTRKCRPSAMKAPANGGWISLAAEGVAGSRLKELAAAAQSRPLDCAVLR